MKKFRFRKFPVYQDARKYLLTTRSCLMKFPPDERFRLIDQINRALNSIVLNIAEGADRSTDKDFALFLNRSHTSVNEVVACLDIAKDLDYITKDLHEELLQESEALANQLTAFRKSLLR